MKSFLLLFFLIVILIWVHINHLHYEKIDLLISKVKYLAENDKPLLIKINAYPSAGKTTFIQSNNYKYKKFKLMDVDDYKYKFNNSEILIDKSKENPRQNMILFGKWEAPKYDDVVYVSIVPPFHIMIKNMVKRVFSNHKTHWIPYQNYMDRHVTITNSKKYNLPILNNFKDAIDLIHREYQRYRAVPKNVNILNEYFDKVYCISVPERKDRMKKIFKKWGLNVNFYDAYLIKNLNKQKLINEGFLDPNCILKDGEICCAYSHYQVHKKFYNSNDKNVLIFEDDLDEGPQNIEEFNKMIAPYLENIPDDWDYINFGPCYEHCIENIDNPYYQESTDPKCLQAAAFNKNSMKYILNASTPLTNKPCDDQIAQLTSDKIFNSYSTHTTLFPQNKTDVKSILGNIFNLRCSNVEDGSVFTPIQQWYIKKRAKIRQFENENL